MLAAGRRQQPTTVPIPPQSPCASTWRDAHERLRAACAAQALEVLEGLVLPGTADVDVRDKAEVRHERRTRTTLPVRTNGMRRTCATRAQCTAHTSCGPNHRVPVSRHLCEVAALPAAAPTQIARRLKGSISSKISGYEDVLAALVAEACIEVGSLGGALGHKRQRRRDMPLYTRMSPPRTATT
jgi:hypothetical protein